MSTYFPWIFALSVGLLAAVSEDFMFRLFGVPYISKLFKSKVVGVIIPAFIWGFLHSTYPQEPGWARGIEVGLIGIAAGWLMLRYSIVANIVWHFTVNSSLTALVIIQQGGIFDIVMCIIVVFLPVFFIGLGFIFGKRKELTANAEMIPPKLETVSVPGSQIPISYEGIPNRKKYLWVAIAVIALIIAIIAPQYPNQTVQIGRKQAESISMNFLQNRGVPVDSFETVASFREAPNSKELLYLYQQKGWNGIDELYGENKWEPLYYWSVRFVISGEKNEYKVFLSPDGKVEFFEHYLEEDDSGATISEDSAFVLAKNLLKQFQLTEILNWELIKKSSIKRPNRTDHYFTWQDIDSIGQAHKRLGISVLGDEPSFDSKFLKRPEEWVREQSKKTAFTVIKNVLPMLLVAILVLMITISFIRGIAKGNVNLKMALWSFIIMAIVSIISFVNSYPTLRSGYYTAWTMERFLTIQIIANIISIIFVSVGAGVAVGAFSTTEFKRKLLLKIPMKDNLFASAVASMIIIGVYSIQRGLEILFDLPLRNIPISIPAGYASYFPILTILNPIATKIFITIPALLVAFSMIKNKLNTRTKIFIAVIIIAIIMGIGGAISLGEIVWNIAKAIMVAITGWFLVTTLLKDNVIMYVEVFLLLFGLYTAARILMPAGNPFYIVNGILAVALSLILWWIIARSVEPSRITVK